jgi:hypothetical protein
MLDEKTIPSNQYQLHIAQMVPARKLPEKARILQLRH